MNPDSDDTCGPGGNHRDSKIDGVGIRDDNRSDLEEPCRNPRPWQCSVCTHENDTSYLSCELCGVLRDLSLYFNNASEVEDGAKHTNKHSGASVLAISLFTPSSAKSKVVVFSDGFQANKNATGNMQTTLDALHKTYMTHKQRRVIVQWKMKFWQPQLQTRLSSWYNGNCLLKSIDSLPPRRDVSKPPRLPICDVTSSHMLGQVAVCGKVDAGAIRSGSKVSL